MTEYVGSRPQQLDTRSLLVLLSVSHHRLQTFFELGQAISLVHHIHIVEAIERDTALRHELKGRIHFIFGTRDGIGAVIPWECLCTATKLVATLGAERMPISHRETEVFFQGLTHHHLVFVIKMEG